MARGRMINRDISLSLKFGELVNDATRLLATWTIPHLDKRGVFHGDAQVVRSLVFPLRQDLSTQEVAAMIDDMERVGLIRRFRQGGRVWQVWPGFADNQPNLRGERERTDFPEPPPTDDCGGNPSTAGFSRAVDRQLPDSRGENPAEVEVEVQEEVQGKVEARHTAPAAANDTGPIPFSEPDPFTARARAARIGNQRSPRSAAAKKKASAQFDIGVLEDAPAIKVHREVCGYVPMTPEQARAIVAGVNGDAETTWRANLNFWMAQGYRANNIDGQTERHATEKRRISARATQPAPAKVGAWQPAKGMYPQVPDRTPEQMEAIRRADAEANAVPRNRTMFGLEVGDVATAANKSEVPF